MLGVEYVALASHTSVDLVEKAVAAMYDEQTGVVSWPVTWQPPNMYPQMQKIYQVLDQWVWLRQNIYQ